jgi:hypothetical protein
MRWEDHSLAELKTVAKAYKKHISIGAVSKMKKPELIAVLDKHLRIDENNKIKVRAEEEKPLMGPNLMKQKEKRSYDSKLKKTQKQAQEKLAMKIKADEDQMREVEQMKRSRAKSPEMTMEEQARADEMRRFMMRPSPPAREATPAPPKAMSQMMGAIADAMAIQAPEMPPRAFAQMLSAISDAMAIKAPETGVYRETEEGTRSRAEYDRLTYLMRKANKERKA